MNRLLITAAVGALVAAAGTAQARDQIRIVGSSTVFPYTQAVAEEFANQGGAAPVVESTGTGGGMQIFCGGVGEARACVSGGGTRDLATGRRGRGDAAVGPRAVSALG